MLVAARAPIQVGIVPWPAATGAVTVVVKRTYDLVTRGAGAPSQEQDSLSLEHREGDVLLFPTDFAPTKSSCDVLVVGRALTDAIGPVRIVVDSTEGQPLVAGMSATVSVDTKPEGAQAAEGQKAL